MRLTLLALALSGACHVSPPPPGGPGLTFEGLLDGRLAQAPPEGAVAQVVLGRGAAASPFTAPPGLSQVALVTLALEGAGPWPYRLTLDPHLLGAPGPHHLGATVRLEGELLLCGSVAVAPPPAGGTLAVDVPLASPLQLLRPTAPSDPLGPYR